MEKVTDEGIMLVPMLELMSKCIVTHMYHRSSKKEVSDTSSYKKLIKLHTEVLYHKILRIIIENKIN